MHKDAAWQWQKIEIAIESIEKLKIKLINRLHNTVFERVFE